MSESNSPKTKTVSSLASTNAIERTREAWQDFLTARREGRRKDMNKALKAHIA